MSAVRVSVSPPENCNHCCGVGEQFMFIGSLVFVLGLLTQSQVLVVIFIRLCRSEFKAMVKLIKID